MRRSNALRSSAKSAPIFAALGDETRLAVVARLCEEGPLSISKLTDGQEVTRQAITKHLHVLELAGLVKGTRDGRENVWRLEPKSLTAARRFLDVISTEWDETLERLRAFVEDE